MSDENQLESSGKDGSASQREQQIQVATPALTGKSGSAGRLETPIQDREIPHFIISEVELEDLERGSGNGDREVLGGLVSVCITFGITAETVKGISAESRGFFWGATVLTALMGLFMWLKTKGERTRNKTLAERVRTRPTSPYLGDQ